MIDAAGHLVKCLGAGVGQRLGIFLVGRRCQLAERRRRLIGQHRVAGSQLGYGERRGVPGRPLPTMQPIRNSVASSFAAAFAKTGRHSPVPRAPSAFAARLRMPTSASPSSTSARKRSIAASGGVGMCSKTPRRTSGLGSA